MNLPELPADLDLKFFAEGAANVVYRILAPPRSPKILSRVYSNATEYGPGTPSSSEILVPSLHSLISGKLLRLRKDLFTVTSILDAQEGFEQLIQPHFRECDLVQQTVVGLPVSLLDRCNDDLREMEAEGARAKKRSGVYLRTDGYGTLVTDMSREGATSFSVGFKPKWLVQSPSAPNKANRCRTCALQAMRASQKAGKESEGHVFVKAGPCPLDLVSEVEGNVYAAIDAIISGSVASLPIASINLADRIARALKTSSLLQRLKQLQLRLDPYGVLAADPTNPKFLTAMALRDCTVFAAGLSSIDGPIEIRLGDLDVKSPLKAGYWRSLEERLIYGGWYTTTESDGDKLIKCALQL